MLFTVLNNEKNSLSQCVKEYGLKNVYNSFKFEFFGDDENAFEYENSGIVLFLQGNIYNILNLHNWLKIPYELNESHPADVIVHLYKKFGMEYTLSILDGVFSLFLLDQRHTSSETTLYVVGDYLGLQPIFALKQNKLKNNNDNDNVNNKFRFIQNRYDASYCLSTDIALLSKLRDTLKSKTNYDYEVISLVPGRCHKYSLSNKSSCTWKTQCDTLHPTSYTFDRRINTFYSIDDVMRNVERYVVSAIQKRLDVHVDKNIVIIVENNSYEAILIACIVSDYLHTNDRSHTLQILFTSKCENSIKLSEVLLAKELLFLPDNYDISELLKRMNSHNKLVSFSNLSIDMKRKKTLMDDDRNIIDNIAISIEKRIPYDDIIVEFPLLDINWIQYFLSINLDHRENILEKSFKGKQFHGKRTKFTL